MRENITLTYIARFWTLVDKSAGINNCWPWNGTRVHGYGEISLDYRKIKAHRFAWVLNNGPIPNGGKILHSCDNPFCCNPNHLSLGTSAVNSAQMVERGRSQKGTKHWSSKLTDDDIRAIRKDPQPQYYIAYKYGITQANVSRIKNKKAWSHVQDKPNTNY